jgi:hypothetical protein
VRSPNNGFFSIIIRALHHGPAAIFENRATPCRQIRPIYSNQVDSHVRDIFAADFTASLHESVKQPCVAVVHDGIEFVLGLPNRDSFVSDLFACEEQIWLAGDLHVSGLYQDKAIDALPQFCW